MPVPLDFFNSLKKKKRGKNKYWLGLFIDLAFAVMASIIYLG